MTPTERYQRILEEGKCIGCGLCVSMFPKKFDMEVAPSGYLRPSTRQPLSERETNAIYGVCPGVVQGGLPEDRIDEETIIDQIWGPYVRIEKAYAADPEMRYRAATGGVLTALCDYLIASGGASAVLHVASGGARPSFGRVHVSRSRDAVLQAAGSVYGPAAPLTASAKCLIATSPLP